MSCPAWGGPPGTLRSSATGIAAAPALAPARLPWCARRTPAGPDRPFARRATRRRSGPRVSRPSSQRRSSPGWTAGKPRSKHLAPPALQGIRSSNPPPRRPQSASHSGRSRSASRARPGSATPDAPSTHPPTPRRALSHPLRSECGPGSGVCREPGRNRASPKSLPHSTFRSPRRYSLRAGIASR